MVDIEIDDTAIEIDDDAPFRYGRGDSEIGAADIEPNPLDDTSKEQRGGRFGRVVAFGLLPAMILLTATATGWLYYRDHTAAAADTARTESVRAATDGTVALLSYQADTADKTLDDARSRLTGTFRDSYSKLIHDVVVPGAKQKHISAVATVPAAAPISTTGQHAVVLVFVNQTTVIGADPPTATASCVNVTLDKVGDRWLISAFDPI